MILSTLYFLYFLTSPVFAMNIQEAQRLIEDELVYPRKVYHKIVVSKANDNEKLLIDKIKTKKLSNVQELRSYPDYKLFAYRLNLCELKLVINSVKNEKTFTIAIGERRAIKLSEHVNRYKIPLGKCKTSTARWKLDRNRNVIEL